MIEIAQLKELIASLSLLVATLQGLLTPAGLLKLQPHRVSESLILGTATGSGSFPTSTLNNFQDGDTVNAGDWNALERKIGIDSSTDTTSLDYMLHQNLQNSSATVTSFKFTNATGTGSVTADRIGNTASSSLRTSSFSVNIVQPSSTTDGAFYKHQFAIPITLTAINCFDMLGTSTINIDRRSSSTPNTAGTNIIGNLSCGVSRGSTSTFVIATTAINQVLNFQVTSTVGIGSTSTLTIIGTYTKD